VADFRNVIEHGGKRGQDQRRDHDAHAVLDGYADADDQAEQQQDQPPVLKIDEGADDRQCDGREADKLEWIHLNIPPELCCARPGGRDRCAILRPASPRWQSSRKRP
jgi:hypothetical protein